MDITERHVQAVWYDAALRPKRLATRRGTPVEVVSPGEWNLGPGPDFTGAVLELGPERRRVVGDVEVHIRPADWDRHGHGADPNYRSVVAHVTWGCGPEARSLPPGAVSIWLGRFALANPAFSADAIDLAAYPYDRLPGEERPCSRALGGDPDRAQALLAEAGRRRLAAKAERVRRRLGSAVASRAGGREQVFYEEVMTALGYSRNAEAFRRVAGRVPIAEMPREPPSARAALLAAGSFEDMDRRCLRPNNSPERRLAAAADVFTSTGTMSLADAADFSRRGCRGMVAVMRGRGAAASRGLSGFIGPGRAAAVIANVVVPFAVAEGRLAAAPDWLPAEDISKPVRLMAFRLFGRDHNPAAFYAGNGLLVQGLLHLFRELCLAHHPLCADCSLGDPLEVFQQPVVSSQQPTASGQQPTASGQQPTANSQQPVVSGQ